MNKYIVHATVYKYDEGLESHTKANVNEVVEAENREIAKDLAEDKIAKKHTMPKISNVRVEIDLINEI